VDEVRRGGRVRNATEKGADYFGHDGDCGCGGCGGEGGDGGGGGNGGGEDAKQLGKLKANVQSTEAQLLAAIAKQTAVKAAKEEWKKAVVCVTKEEFLEMGAAGLQPGFDYYTQIYNNPNGKLFGTKRAYQGATVFNPLKIKELDYAAVCLLIDLLSGFGFEEFTPEFLQGMKDEAPAVMKSARENFDWSGVQGAAKYDASLQRKLQRKAAAAASKTSAASSSSSSSSSFSSSSSSAAAEPTLSGLEEEDARIKVVRSWEDGASEKARRIWEWWRVRVHHVKIFHYWPIALRLVALVQPSSARMERVFSQLKLVLDSVGSSCLEETVEARMLVRENKGL
jgi:hypothetical protein